MSGAKSKCPAQSETIMTEVVCPNDTNPMGILLGGRLVQWMDIACAVSAQNHAERICVTVCIERVLFKAPARVGDIVTIKARPTKAFTSSMEIKVVAFAKKVLSQKEYPVGSAYMTFVALDDNAQPVSVPLIKPKTVLEKREYRDADIRKEQQKSQTP